MLLAVLDLARSGALLENRITYAPALLERYTQYFNAVRAPGDHPNPYFPFFHLKGRLTNNEEGFWHLSPLPGREGILQGMGSARSSSAITENIECAKLDPELFELLQDVRNIDQLADALATHWFNRGLQDLDSVVLQAKQISVYEHSLRDLHIERNVEESTPSYVRGPAFRRVVTEVYDYRCAATGLRLVLPDGTAMVEAAHIHPFSECGDDDPRNGLALTPDMHWAMDRNLIAPGSDYRWHVSKQLDGRIPDYKMLTELDGKSLFLPREQRMYPRLDVLEWRARNLPLGV
jgi:putative restriction endonuclease